MLILAIEASTSSAKAMLYHSTKGAIGTLSRNYSAAAGDTMTYDADEMMVETFAVARELLNEQGMARVDMVTACSIWSHSLVMLDQCKQPLGRLRTWADTSASITTEKYRRDSDLFTSLYRRTGCPIHTSYTLWKYLHEKEHGRAKQVAFVASMPEYLFLKLTGQLVVSRSTASAGGFLNTHSLEWDPEALRLTGIDGSMLPGLVESEYTAPLGQEAARILGLPEGTPVLITGADGCMNHVAAGAFGADIMTLSVGTSAALRMAADKPILADRPSTWCYVGVENNWIVGSATAGAGNCVSWMGKTILGHKNCLSLQELGTGAKAYRLKDDAPIFLPFLVGERCPGWDDTRTGMLCDLRISHDIYSLYYAVLEGVLFNLKQCYDISRPIMGREPECISISGGIEESELWLSMAASIFGLPVHTNGLMHSSLLGSAYMGLKAAGLLASVAEIRPVNRETYRPDEEQSHLLSRRYTKYLKYYAQCS